MEDRKKSMIKIDSIKFDNHAFLENLEVSFNDAHTRLIGINESGKSSLLDAIEQCFNGMAERGKGFFFGDRFKIVGKRGKSVKMSLKLIDTAYGNAEIIIERRISGANNGKLTFKAPDNYPISHEWLANLFDSAFLSVKNFTALSSKEQALKMGIDTSEFDEKMKALKSEHKEINSKYFAFGPLEPVEKVEPVNVEKLADEKAALEAARDEQYAKNVAHNKTLREDFDARKLKKQEEAQVFNGQQAALAYTREEIKEAITVLQAHNCPFYKELAGWYTDDVPHPAARKDWKNLAIDEPEYIDEMPDKSEIVEIDKQIVAAHETNRKADAYKAYLHNVAAKDALKLELQKNKKQQKELETERNDFIKKHDLPFAGLSIDENGNLMLDNQGGVPCEIREPYFSKGRLRRIVPQLFSSRDSEFKIIVIDDADLIYEDNLKALVESLVEQGYQVIAAHVGRSAPGENIITLSLPKEEDKPKKPELK